jgi:hypothetical protein
MECVGLGVGASVLSPRQDRGGRETVDERHFDRLTQVIGSGVSRRHIVVALLASALGLRRFNTAGMQEGCAPGLTRCGQDCLDLSTHPFSCGACGNACQSGICVNGECAPPKTCAPGLTDCRGTCVDTATDIYNCGGCFGFPPYEGRQCLGIAGPGESSVGICVDGQCQTVCQPDADSCDDTCTDLAKDGGNCGSCGTQCNVTDGICCGGRCVGSASAERFCENCGFQSAWPQGCNADEVCDRGICVRVDGTAAASDPRTVTATAICTGDRIEVKVVNTTGSRISIGYGRTSTDATNTVTDVAVERGASSTLDLSGSAQPVDGALVVTSAGLLLPTCGGTVGVDIGPCPPSEDERRTEWPAIGARTIAGLEAERAFDALYTLMHSDAKALVTEARMTCWYADYLGEMTSGPARVTGVTLGPWAWSGSGKTYDAAEIVYNQQFFVDGAPADLRTSTEHLVLEDGQWRWFLGTDPSWLASLPSTCASVSG